MKHKILFSTYLLLIWITGCAPTYDTMVNPTSAVSGLQKFFYRLSARSGTRKWLIRRGGGFG